MAHRALILLAFAFAPIVQAAERITVAPVQYREVAKSYSADGVVEAAKQTTVSAQIAGRVKEILFDVGDRVGKGQVILRIDEREAVQVVAVSQAQLMQAQVAMQNAKLNYERARQLFAQRFISQAALDKAQADYKMALAQAAANEAGAEQSTLAHGYTAVVAPYGGVVSARLVEVGEMVTVGKPLMSGFDPTQMRVIVEIPQYKLAEIGPHPQAMIEFSPHNIVRQSVTSQRLDGVDTGGHRGVPDGSDVTLAQPSLKQRVRATSVTVLPTADSRTHTTQVRVYLPANEVKAYPGMFVRVEFVLGKAKKLLIPSSAVMRRSEVVAVYVVDDKGETRLRQVRLGEPVGQGEIEVLAGLNPGENVALDPVRAGMKQRTEDRGQKTEDGTRK